MNQFMVKTVETPLIEPFTAQTPNYCFENNLVKFRSNGKSRAKLHGFRNPFSQMLDFDTLFSGCVNYYKMVDESCAVATFSKGQVSVVGSDVMRSCC